MTASQILWSTGENEDFILRLSLVQLHLDECQTETKAFSLNQL